MWPGRRGGSPALRHRGVRDRALVVEARLEGEPRTTVGDSTSGRPARGAPRADSARERRKHPERSRGSTGPAAAPIFSLHGRAEVSPGEARLETLAARVAIALIAAALLYIALVPHRVGDYFAETDFYGDYAKGARLIQSGRLVPSRYGVVGPAYEVARALVGFAARD